MSRIVDDEEQRVLVVQGKFITSGQVDAEPLREVLGAWMRLQDLARDASSGKVFSPQNRLKSNSSWRGENLVASTQAGMLGSLPMGATLIQKLKVDAAHFEPR